MSPRYVVRSVPDAGGEGFLCPHEHEGMQGAVRCFLEPRAGVTKTVHRLDGRDDIWTVDLTPKERERFVELVAELVTGSAGRGLRALRAGLQRALDDEATCAGCGRGAHDGDCT